MATEVFEETQRVPPKKKMTFEEFLDWCDEDTWAEWVDGEVVWFHLRQLRISGSEVFLKR